MDTLDCAGIGQMVYLVLNDSGRLGRAWFEADVERTDLETVIQDILAAQYNNPVGVFGFNPVEGWSQDVSEDIAQDLRRRCDLQMRDVPSSIQDFVEQYKRYDRQQLTLRLV